jgi:hypothetical protein
MCIYVSLFFHASPSRMHISMYVCVSLPYVYIYLWMCLPLLRIYLCMCVSPSLMYIAKYVCVSHVCIMCVFCVLLYRMLCMLYTTYSHVIPHFLIALQSRRAMGCRLAFLFFIFYCYRTGMQWGRLRRRFREHRRPQEATAF